MDNPEESVVILGLEDKVKRTRKGLFVLCEGRFKDWEKSLQKEPLKYFCEEREKADWPLSGWVIGRLVELWDKLNSRVLPYKRKICGSKD